MELRENMEVHVNSTVGTSHSESQMTYDPRPNKLESKESRPKFVLYASVSFFRSTYG